MPARHHLLYEGNWTEWSETIDSHILDADLPGATYLHAQRSGFCNSYSGEETQEAAMILLPKVSESVLSRIPDWAHRDSVLLLQRLEDTAQPFGFLCLPPELRGLVYTFIAQDGPQLLQRVTRSAKVLCIDLRSHFKGVELGQAHQQGPDDPDNQAK